MHSKINAQLFVAPPSERKLTFIGGDHRNDAVWATRRFELGTVRPSYLGGENLRLGLEEADVLEEFRRW